jgi:hypothetical protein
MPYDDDTEDDRAALEDRRPTDVDVQVLTAVFYLAHPVSLEDPAATASAVAALLNVGHGEHVVSYALRLVVEHHRAHTGPTFDDFDFLNEVQEFVA